MPLVVLCDTMKNRLPLKFLGATLLIALFWFSIMFMYIDDLMSDDQTDDKTNKVKVKDEVTEEVKGTQLGQQEKLSRLRRMRAGRRKRHKKFFSTTTVSDFEIYKRR